MTGNAPSSAPVPKVAAAGVGGGLATAIIALLGSFGLDLTAEAGAAISTIVAFASAYVKKG